MSPEFRTRVFTPVILPLTIVGVILAFAMALSRVLLAVPESVSTLTAIVVAGYILLVSSLIAARPRITPRALGVGLVLGFVGVLAAGAVAGAAGMRSLEHEEGGGEGGEAPPAPGGEIPADALVFAADVNLAYTSAPTTAPAGEVTIAIDNQGGLPHNVTIEGVEGDEPIVEATNGTDVNTVTLEPGSYTYYCSIPGHRAGGMEGQLTVQ
jgi:plastocyanin